MNSANGIGDRAAWGDESTDRRLRQLFHDYYEQYLILFPLEATGYGDARYNHLLPIDISPEYMAKKRDFFSSMRNRLDGIDRSSLDDSLQLPAEVLKYELETRLEGLSFGAERIPFTQFEGLPISFGQMGSGAGIHPFQSVKDYDDWLQRMTAFSSWSMAAVERFREGIRDGHVLPKILVERMIQQLLDPTLVSDQPEQSLFYGPVTRMPSSFSKADRDRLAVAFAKAIREDVIPAYQRLGIFLRDEYLPHARSTSGLLHLRDGKSYYEYCVRFWTTTRLHPDEVFAIGQAEVDRIRNEIREVQQSMGHQGTLDEFFAFLREDPQFKPFSSAEEVLHFFRALQAKLEPQLQRAFLTHPKSPFEIRRTESFREKTASAEYVPGTADGSRPGIFYVPIPDAKAFNITSGMESLFLHEALPGHHYQISLQQENQQLPTFARFLWYGAYGEGWALYCESIGKELGLYTDPKQLVGALGDEMHRAIRLVVDVGIHWKGWTREEAIAYMMSNEPLSEAGTIAEIERYMAYPGQSLSYKIGQLTITRLRREAEAKLGDRFDLASFHDRILRDGGMPLHLLEIRLRKWMEEAASSPR